MSKHVNWSGVFPAVTTQFNADFSVNLEETHTVISNLVRDGVSGLVVCGSVGENTSLTIEEKMAVTEVAERCLRRPRAGDLRDRRVHQRRRGEGGQGDGAGRRRRHHGDAGAGLFLQAARDRRAFPQRGQRHRPAGDGLQQPADLPERRHPGHPGFLADCENIVCFKDSSGDTRRFIDVRNQVGERFILFAGLDDVVLESVAVGAQGWISGMSNVFPKEGETIFRLARAGRFAEAMPIYEWLMPILHLDARPDLVQCIKLCEQLAGRGSVLTRPPRLALRSADREHVERIMAKALASRPALPDVGL